MIFINKFEWITICIFTFTVVKAEIVTQESINLEQSYVFPDDTDNITNFIGRKTHIVLPSMLLKDVHNKLSQGR